MNSWLTAMAVMLLCCLPAAALDPKRVRSLWPCDDSTEDRLIPANALSPVGFFLAYTNDEIRAWPSRGLVIPALTSAQRLVMPLPGGGNGGAGTPYINQWTLVMDVKVTVTSYANYTSLLQTTPQNNNDVDFFITPKGALGVGPDPSAEGIVAPGTWHRIALTCGNNGAGGPLTLRAYVDGKPVLTATGRTYNGAYALESTALLFSDDNGETQPLSCNSVAFWREALSDADLAALGGPAATGISPFIATNGADAGPGSLRRALLDAAELAGPDVIHFAPGATEISLGTEIKSTDADAVTLDGSSATVPVTIRPAGTARLFNISSTHTVSFRCLTLSSGRGGGELTGLGGAILNDGTCIIQRCTFSGNTGNSGGAIYNDGDLTLTRCTFSGNSARAGGALYLSPGSTCTASACTLTGGRATSGSGGGIRALEGLLTLNECVVAGNTDTSGSGPDMALDTTALTSRQNLIGSATGSGITHGTGGNLAGTAALPLNPALAPLDDYGGPTRTHVLLPGSPARNAAPLAGSSLDQRGYPTIFRADIGACESGNYQTFRAWSWETLPATATSAQHGPEVDYDSDGVPNRDEWSARTDPANPASFFRITSFQRIDPNLRVTFPTANGRIYSVEHSEDLASWTTVAENIAGTGAPVSITIGPVTGYQRTFLRARVGP